ncbi:MAG: hypothetical protein HQ565_08045 [Bacteroidetes bacterium]|nr:hypothetical protein [Bacteroidota bacterium]
MINQLKYPKEFRILPLKMPLEALKQLEELIKNHTKTAPLSNVPLIEKEANKEFLAEVSVGAWRLKKKMIDVETGQPFDEMNRTYRHLESILLTLEKEGIEIQDHDGQQFDAGLSLKVLAYQPTPNIDQEYVLETIKPSIYLKGDRILMGEVIVSTFIKEDQRN